ncbi:MAG: serine/threonine protein kinase [Myxococcales bacterium]|nr:serine/threonine protein kinase [Myxococcales bacterium]
MGPGKSRETHGASVDDTAATALEQDRGQLRPGAPLEATVAASPGDVTGAAIADTVATRPGHEDTVAAVGAAMDDTVATLGATSKRPGPVRPLGATVVSAPRDDRDAALANTAASIPQSLATRPDHARPRARELPLDTHIGRMKILRTLGAGGMGVVYAAYDPELDREVAVKLIRGANNDAARTRLQREAQALAKLAHPNVVAVHDVGTHNGQVWVAMEFVVGRTLGEWLTQERPRWRQVLSVIKQAARGLAAAHAEGLLHRDVKPDNIMVGDDWRVRVMDFGLARAEGARVHHHDDPKDGTSVLSVELTAVGAIMGTPAYMAPEQFLGLRADERTDEFSLAVTLWEALYGQRPFAGDTFQALSVAVTSGTREPAPANSKVPGWLRRVLERALDVDRNKRFESVRVMLEAIEQREQRGRVRVVVAGLSSGLLVMAVLGVLAAVQPLPARHEPWRVKRRSRKKTRPSRGKTSRTNAR